MRLAPLALIALCALVLFTGLDRTGLLDVREARDAEVARELVSSREVLTPLIGHEPLLAKPVLAYAPEVAAALMPGPPAIRSRQLRALAAVLLVLLTMSLAAEHFGMRAAWWTGLVLASTIVLPLAARTDGTQIYATLFGWLGCAGLADATFGRRAGRGGRLLVVYVALAGALVVAGPLPALWPLGGLALYLALSRSRGGWRRVALLPGLVLMAGVALPWYGAMVERNGWGFFSHAAFFPYAAGARGSWISGPLLATSFFVIGFFPWSGLMPGALLHAATWWRRARTDGIAQAGGSGIPSGTQDAAPPRRFDPVTREHREESAAHFFIACLIAALIPILFYPGPPMPSVLPAIPAAALLCGRMLDHLFEDPERLGPLFGRACLMLALFGSAVSVGLAVVATRLPDAAGALRLIAVITLLGSWAPFLANLLRRRRIAAVLMVLPVALGAPAATFRLLPALEPWLSARPVAEAMNEVAPPRAALLLIEPPAPSLRFYTRHNLVVTDTLGADLVRHRAADSLAYLAFRPSREHEVLRDAGRPIEILLRTPSLVLARAHRR